MNQTEKITRVTVIGEGLPTCVTCKFWVAGECRADVPEVGPEGKAVWPITEATHGCGRWRNSVAAVGLGSDPKVSLEAIVTYLRENCEPMNDQRAMSIPRRDLILWLVQEHNMSNPAALARLKTLERKGLMQSGMEPPPEYPASFKGYLGKLVFVWPAPGMEKKLIACSGSNEERLMSRLNEVAPAGGPGIGVRALWRACSDLGLSLGTIHRLLGQLFARGQVERVGKDWRCSGAAGTVGSAEVAEGSAIEEVEA